MSISDLEDVAFWVMMPTVKLTENNERKWVRLLGIFGMIPLFPLAFVGSLLLFLVVIIDIIQEA